MTASRTSTARRRPPTNMALRLSPELVEHVKTMAAAERRSRTNMASVLLEEAVNARLAAPAERGALADHPL